MYILSSFYKVQQRQRSSYSSACDATIRAQCALTDAGESSKKLLNGTVAEAGATKTPLATPSHNICDTSPAKRSSPTSESEDPKSKQHKYVRVFGGKPSLPQTIPHNVSERILSSGGRILAEYY